MSIQTIPTNSKWLSQRYSSQVKHPHLWLRSLLSTLRRIWTLHRATNQLMEMPDHMLKDIGLTRGEISSAVDGRRTFHLSSR